MSSPSFDLQRNHAAVHSAEAIQNIARLEFALAYNLNDVNAAFDAAEKNLRDALGCLSKARANWLADQRAA